MSEPSATPDVTIVDVTTVENSVEEPAEFRMLRSALDTDQLGVTWVRLPPGADIQGDKGHFHDEQDEVYVVVSGGPVTLKAGDDLHELAAGHVARVAARTLRALRNLGDEEAILVAISGRRPPQGDDSHPVDGFWPEEKSSS